MTILMVCRIVLHPQLNKMLNTIGNKFSFRSTTSIYVPFTHNIDRWFIEYLDLDLHNFRTMFYLLLFFFVFGEKGE